MEDLQRLYPIGIQTFFKIREEPWCQHRLFSFHVSIQKLAGAALFPGTVQPLFFFIVYIDR